jgi:hypothetical protein
VLIVSLVDITRTGAPPGAVPDMSDGQGRSRDVDPDVFVIPEIRGKGLLRSP